uniref:FTH domain-containing protein n=1 Tax=Caenorhabditis tropicalis TaxID=1561998 RepID=A0A1I7UDN6_9PELO
MDYFKNQRGTTVSWYKNCVRTSKSLEDADYVGVAFEDISAVFQVFQDKNTVLEVFRMDFHGKSEGKRCQEKLISILKNHKIGIFEITVMEPKDILEILLLLDPESLKRLRVTGSLKRGDAEELGSQDMEEMVRMEQWKGLEELEIREIWIQTPIQNFFHLKRINVAFKEVTVEMVLELKEAYLSLTQMEYLEIHYETSNSKEKLIQLHGPPLEETSRFGVTTWKWFFKIPEFQLSLSICYVRNSIIFDCVNEEN